MQRRLHPSYARNTAQISFGLVAGGIASLVGGLIAKEVGLRDLGTVLNIAFGAFAIVLAFRWFNAGETTTCPECGSALSADKVRTRRLGLTFRCRPCNILWLTQPEPGALEATDDSDLADIDSTDDEPEADHAEDHDPDADGYDGEDLVDGEDPFETTAQDEANPKK